MVQSFGKGQPGDLVRPIFHHAQGVRDTAFAVLAGLWVHDVHTDPTRHHRLHVGKGANGLNLYLDNGESFAFRGAVGSDGYNCIAVHRGSIRPLGPVVLRLYKPEDTDQLWNLLSSAVS